MMKNLLCMSFVLSLLISKVSEGKVVKRFINNIQTANGSDADLPDFFPWSTPKEIPLDMIIRMNEIANTEEFIEKFVYTDLSSKDESIVLKEFSNSAGNQTLTQRSSNAAIYSRAVCKPELQTVPVTNLKGPSIIYNPSCIRIERCGGCCVNNLLSCKPIESEIIPVKVLVLEYRGGTKMFPKGQEIFPVERHTQCRCLCRIQSEDCNPFQVYNSNSCSCECANPDAEKKCRNDRQNNKIWNKEVCSCQCKEELECSTGFYFDNISCRCEVQEGRRKLVENTWVA